jgi:hypothetical protein
MSTEGWMFKPGEGRKMVREIEDQKLDYVTEKTLEDGTTSISNVRLD